MITVTRKTEIEPIDGTPVKRVFWSIISDYNLKTGLSELVDNALDTWLLTNHKNALVISIGLDVGRQLVSVTDNAGGVRQRDLSLLIAPGGSRNDPSDEIIGIFGVGSKRAGVALGEHVEIRTRFARERSYQLDITADWLTSDDWQLAAYEIPNIAPGTTQVDISRLREPFSEVDVEEIHTYLGETYAWFLRQGCVVKVNGVGVPPLFFDCWAFPRGFPPRRAKFDAPLTEKQKIAVEITAGLILDRNAEIENYGVYFYCNHRLIAKELRTRDVGYFVSSEAGVPHPDASLCRAIVRLQGPAQLMPWNSSKSGINFSHPAFRAIRPTLIPLVSHFSSLSRRLKDDWDGKVFRFDGGEIENIEASDYTPGGRLILPPLPRVRRHRVDELKSRNRQQIREQPWTLGLVEAIGAVDIIRRQRFETKNRISLILLDSNFEIALKEFIVHRSDLFPLSSYNDARIQALFRNRQSVIKEVTAKAPMSATLLQKVEHYYGLRNKMIHERATVDVGDSDIENYRATIEEVLRLLFNLRFTKS
jgi:hypothetical protein